MSTQDPSGRTGFAAVADRLAGLTDPSMGDEREQSIILRAGTVAMTVSIFTIQLLGLFLAVIGAGMWSGVVVFAAVIPGLVYTWYCRSAGLDTDVAYARVAPRRRVVSIASGIALAIAWIGAVSFHMIQGTPLIPVGLGSVEVGDTSTASGLLVGGLVGGAAGVFVTLVRSRSGARRASQDQDLEDDED